MIKSLLPPNSTPLERATAAACAPLGALPTPLRALWQPDACPQPLLPYLAWALSVDHWNTAWSAAMQRRVIQAAFSVHQRKGTIRALREALEPFDYRLDVQEWWQASPEDPPGTFRLRVSALNQALSEDNLREIERLIEGAKPVSRPLLSLALLLESHGPLRVGVACFDGGTLRVYPYVSAQIVAHGPLAAQGALHLIDWMRFLP